MADTLPWWVRPALAVAIVALLATALLLAFWSGDDGLEKLIVGVIMGSFSTTIGYYFGSSDSSQKKDATIAAANAALAVSTPPPSPAP